MKRYVPAVMFCSLLLAPIVTARTTEQDGRMHITEAIEHRLQAQQSIDVSADSVILTGTLLHLKGQARIVWLPDTVIRAEEVKIDAGSVELIGDVNASWGASSGVGLPPPPRVEYR